MTELEWPRQWILIGGGHFVSHLDYRMLDKTHIPTWMRGWWKQSIYEIWKKSDWKWLSKSDHDNKHWWAAAILLAILVIGCRTKPIFKLERKVDESNSYIKFGRNLIKNDWVRVTTKADTDRWLPFCQPSCYRMSDKTPIRPWTRGWLKQSIYEIWKKSD